MAVHCLILPDAIVTAGGNESDTREGELRFLLIEGLQGGRPAGNWNPSDPFRIGRDWGEIRAASGTAADLSFEAQRGHEVDTGGAPGGDPNRQESDATEQERRGDEGRRVPGFDPEQEAGEEAGHTQS